MLDLRPFGMVHLVGSRLWGLRVVVRGGLVDRPEVFSELGHQQGPGVLW